MWMTTCVGSMWLASTGVLDGKKCTTNRGFLPTAKIINPSIEWLDQRWVVEDKPYEGSDGKGELWTAGAAGAGEFLPSATTLQRLVIRGYSLTTINSGQGSR